MVGCDEAKRRPWAGEERLASAKHEGAEVQSILIDEANVAQASRQVRSGDFNLAAMPGLQLAGRLDTIREKCGVGAERPQRARDHPLRLAPPYRRVIAFCSVPVRLVFIPIPHYLVHAATVHHAGHAAHLLDEVTKERRTWPKRRVVDFAIPSHFRTASVEDY